MRGLDILESVVCVGTGEDCGGRGIVMPKVKDAAAKGADRTEVGVTAGGVTNHFAPDCIFLLVKCEGSEGCREYLGVRGSCSVQSSLPKEELDILQFEGRRLGQADCIFSWS